jgi:hypothetical protein
MRRGDWGEEDNVFAIFERGNGIPWSGSHLRGASPRMIDSVFLCTSFLIRSLPCISSVLFLSWVFFLHLFVPKVSSPSNI